MDAKETLECLLRESAERREKEATSMAAAIREADISDEPTWKAVIDCVLGMGAKAEDLSRELRCARDGVVEELRAYPPIALMFLVATREGMARVMDGVAREAAADLKRLDGERLESGGPRP